MDKENVVPMEKGGQYPSDKEIDTLVQKWGLKCLDLIQEMADEGVHPSIGAFVFTETAVSLSLSAGLPGIKMVLDRLSEQMGIAISKETEKAQEVVDKAISEIKKDKK